MFQIRYATIEDIKFWFTLDKHISERELIKKMNSQRAYIILDENNAIGIMRFNLFWDNTPFLTMIYINKDFQSKEYGRKAVEYWEEEMRNQGYNMAMTSTQVDEKEQYFYRKIGYKDCGCLVMDIPGSEQPMEMFFIKSLQ